MQIFIRQPARVPSGENVARKKTSSSKTSSSAPKQPGQSRGLPADVQAVLSDLQSRKGFSAWKEGHGEHRLAYIFTDYAAGRIPLWQVGFYKGKRMTSFTLAKTLAIDEDQEVYSSEDPLSELDLSSVGIGFAEAIAVAERAAAKHAPFTGSQVMAVLQMIHGAATWNITLVSRQYTFLNAKVDASSGKVLHEEFSPLFTIAKEIHGRDESLPKAG